MLRITELRSCLTNLYRIIYLYIAIYINIYLYIYTNIGSASSRATIRRLAFQRTLQKLVAHDSWTAGAKIGNMSAALRSDQVDMASTRAQIEFRMDAVFKYDAIPVPNPPGTFKPQIVCSTHLGGLCVKDRHCGAIRSLVKNIHTKLLDNKVCAKQIVGLQGLRIRKYVCIYVYI